jgi:hypothetical protein
MNAVAQPTTHAQIDALSHREKITYLVQELKKVPQIDCPLKHYFAPGVYLREIFMPSGSVVIGKIHKTEHFNIIERGVCSIFHEDGEREVLQAPMTFVSKSGIQKVLYIHEDTIWKTIHVTAETDLVKLEDILIEPPQIVMLEIQEAAL